MHLFPGKGNGNCLGTCQVAFEHLAHESEHFARKRDVGTRIDPPYAGNDPPYAGSTASWHLYPPTGS